MPHAAPVATIAGIAARSAGSSVQNPKNTIIGGTSAGVMIGHRYGGVSLSASRSSALIAATPDAGSNTTAATAAGHGIRPATPVTSSRMASSTHSRMISSAVKPCAMPLPAASL